MKQGKGNREGKGKYKHWTRFVVESPSMRKSEKRRLAGLCIGCGKKPCECRRSALRRT